MYPSHTRKILAMSLAAACSSILPSAVAAGTVSGSDSFTGSEAVMSPRFFRSGTPGGACSTFSSGNFQYRTYPIQSDGSGQVSATFDPATCSTNAFVTFHTGEFNPASICDGYSWSFGSSQAFSDQLFNVTPHTAMTMVVSGVPNAPGVVCGPYSWQIGGAYSNKNFWISKLKATNKPDAGADSWQAKYIYNTDRRDAGIFDPTSEGFSVSFGNNEIAIPAGSFIVSSTGVFTYKSPKGAVPVISIKGTPSKQTIDVKVSKTDVVDLPKNAIVNKLVMGGDSLSVDAAFSEKSVFTPYNSYTDGSFVVSKNIIKGIDGSKGSINTSFKLAAPTLLSDFMFSDCKDNCNKPGVVLRVKEGATLLLEKDLTSLLAATKKTDKNSLITYAIKKVSKDASPSNTLTKFSYNSKTDTLVLGLSKAALLAPMTPVQANISIELVIDGDSYETFSTMFALDADNTGYSSSFTKITPAKK